MLTDVQQFVRCSKEDTWHRATVTIKKLHFNCRQDTVYQRQILNQIRKYSEIFQPQKKLNGSYDGTQNLYLPPGTPRQNPNQVVNVELYTSIT